MRFWLLCTFLLSLGASQGASAGSPKAVPPKTPPKAMPPKAAHDFSKVEARGTIGSGSEWAPYRVFKTPPIRTFLTIKIQGQGEWELVLDEDAEKVLSRSIGKQVTITGSLSFNAIDVKTVNGLDLK